MKLIVITSEKSYDKEIDVIKQLFKAGMNTLHIRKPGFSRMKMKAFINDIPEKYHKKLVLHSHHSLSFTFKIKGIHFTEKHRKNVFLHNFYLRFYKIFKTELQFSASYHSIKEVEKLPANKYKYVFLSPVFQSISKDNKKKDMNLSRIQDALRETKAKVIALGGIESDKLVRCQNVGFVGIAVLGNIWQSPDPIGTFTHLYELCKKARYQSLALED
ncbi:MAG: thiamine phosphate synthase [Sphingobacteriales bacterium]|nr:MAG: thiamine phosphate synthase [Sphingobacteriales bacterium]